MLSFYMHCDRVVHLLKTRKKMMLFHCDSPSHQPHRKAHLEYRLNLDGFSEVTNPPSALEVPAITYPRV